MSDLNSFFRTLSAIARDQWAGAEIAQFDDKGVDRFDPVTTLDRGIERAMRQAILERFPDDGVWGEEEGWTNEGARRHWSLDPVDGTRALICDLPSWAVLVGLIEEGRHVGGMIDCPPLGELLLASGGAASRDGVPIRTSGCARLAEARLSTTDPHLFDEAEAAAFDRVRRQALVLRLGLDALAYARVATGGIDLVIESGLKRHDLDAPVAVVRAAGGYVGDWQGGEDWEGGRIVAAASRALYDEAVALLSA